MAIELFLYILVLATSVPAGLLLARLCEDEIVVYRKYILATMYSAVILAVLLYVAYFNWTMMLGLVYIIFVFLAVIIKSHITDKKR